MPSEFRIENSSACTVKLRIEAPRRSIKSASESIELTGSDIYKDIGFDPVSTDGVYRLQ